MRCAEKLIARCKDSYLQSHSPHSPAPSLDPASACLCLFQSHLAPDSTCSPAMSPHTSPSAQPLVSVVTPFHNTAEYLAECIESVIHQSYQNWEYILLDNCSTDGSDQIARKYAASERRIRLMRNNTLLPQVQNYNAALSHISAQSSYCKMVQADDWIYPECLERMVKVAESDPSVGIVSSYALWGDRILGDGLPYTTTVVPGPEICRQQLLTSLFLFGSPTTLLYRSEIVRGTSPFFDPSTLHDDTDACYRILRTWKLGFAHQILSFSRVDKSSVMARARQFGAEPIDKLLQLSKFGPVYLESNELAACLETCKSDYYRFLARRFLSGSSIAFWRYHVSGLRSGGQRLEKVRLLEHLWSELLLVLMNPGLAWSRLYGRFRVRSK
jgi:glycosyltransferase involved in cell wall biosynthesis